jgi:hypothetical protein
MRKIILFFFLLIFATPGIAQNGFQFNKRKSNKISVPFKLINNLVFIPIEVNGIELTFLLDSGVEETILFSLEGEKEINLKNIEKINIRGLGSNEPIDGLRSNGNLLDVKGMKSEGHLLYVILDSSFNLSAHVGITVNGIIGYSIFKNNLIEINYNKKKVFFYKENSKNRKRIERKFTKIPITIERRKPYVNTSVVIDSTIINAKLLIDSGNSDAVWLYENNSKNIHIPKKNFEDYLGQGLSGSVEGKRARISEFSIAKFKFNNPIVAFPDSTSIRHILLVSNRLGSIGGEILKRFSVVFDYNNGNIFLKKNKEYNSPFGYNKSGIEVQHSGVQWVKELISKQDIPVVVNPDQTDPVGAVTNFKYQFELKPVYEISNIRKNSEAANSGLHIGDLIKAINGKMAYRYSLQEINSLLRDEDEKWIELEVEREGELMKFKFKLVNIL